MTWAYLLCQQISLERAHHRTWRANAQAEQPQQLGGFLG